MKFHYDPNRFPKNHSGGKKKKKKKKAGKQQAPGFVQSNQKPHFPPKIPSILPVARAGFFDIERYSHHFVIKNISAAGQLLVNKFAMGYVQWETVGFGPYARKVPKRTFAARVKPLNQYRFHKGQWNEFVQFLSNNGTDIEDVNITVYGLHPPKPLDAQLTTEKTPRPLQVPIIDYLISDKPSKHKMLEVQAGVGKAQPLDAPIKVPGGWSTMGEMYVGKEVITPKGTVTRVSDVHPQGVLDIYRITFADGRSAECCENHLWKVHFSGMKSKNYWAVKTLKEIAGSAALEIKKAYIPLVASEQNECVDLPEDPYALGFNLKDETIPETYLNGSHKQRLALLSGLMDSYGTVMNAGVKYRTRREDLAKVVQYLVHSIGGLASIKTYEDSKGPLYHVSIHYERSSELFTDPVKQSLTSDKRTAKFSKKLRIEKIEYVGKKPAQCISLEDEDHLYVTNDFIVTHNTFMTACAADALNYRMIMFLGLQFATKWVSDVDELLHITGDDLLFIQGTGSLLKGIALVSSGALNPKAIIVSNRTYQNWIKHYEEFGDTIIEEYGCTPATFIETMGAGLRVIDEVHLNFHLNVKIDLYTHVERSIALSATLIDGDPFISRMHEMAYPNNERYNDLPFNKYVDAFSIRYRFRNPELLETSEKNSDMYSHHAFERSIINNKTMLQAYFSFIEKMIKQYYDKRAKPGEKCLVYCTSIALCTILTEFLKESFPHRDVRRYCELDPYENLLEPEIPVSTIQSAGTGHDLSDLITVVMTTAINSKASNIQGFGRLREIKGTPTYFVFFTCDDVQRQVKYCDEKMQLLATRTTSLKTINYPAPIDEGLIDNQ